MLPVFKDDPELCAHESHIMNRINAFRGWKEQFRKNEEGIQEFAAGYKIFGFQRLEAEKKWTFTEWLPAARKVFLVGEFNNWENTHPLKPGEFGRWSIDLPDRREGWLVPHRSQVRLRIEGPCGVFDRVPAWTKLAQEENPSSNVFSGVMWEPPPSERYVMRHARPARPRSLKVYEAHVGLAGGDPRIHTYQEFKELLPRIKRLGYNAVQLLAVLEHEPYSSMGRQVTSFFAPTRRCGSPDELKELVDTAHAYGITMLMDLPHSQMSPNQLNGLASMDGTDHCYTHAGGKGWQEQWGSSLFDYGKYEVLRFLLSNIRWWIEEYGFDGFRFRGVTSMLYNSHGIGKSFRGSYKEYFGWDSDNESSAYLMLANYLIKKLLPSSGVSLGEDESGMPSLCRPVEEGGFGFDLRLAPAVKLWATLLREPDEAWNVSDMVRALQKRRLKEPCVVYAESHEQAISCQTLASWLVDAAGDGARGLALHKMIRLVTLAMGGEGYLNFMGNEFAHPGELSLPCQANGWTYTKATRHFDLPQDGNSQFKCFEAFDEAMLALESRFKFLSTSQFFLSRKDDSDKVLIFEHGDCLFIFNFHPTRSYTDYRVGHAWDEGMRVVLDSDEARFGGQDRLASAHATPSPTGDGWDSRYHSTRVHVPSRTVQVMVRESLVQGGVVVQLAIGSTSAWPFPAGELLLVPVDEAGNPTQVLNFKGSHGRLAVNLPGPTAFKVYWEVQNGRAGRASKRGGTKVNLPFALDIYRVHFPGTYILDCFGNLKCESPSSEEGDGVPVGCKDAPVSVSRPQYVRAKTQNYLAPSDMPEESKLEAASQNVPPLIAVSSERKASRPVSLLEDMPPAQPVQEVRNEVHRLPSDVEAAEVAAAVAAVEAVEAVEAAEAVEAVEAVEAAEAAEAAEAECAPKDASEARATKAKEGRKDLKDSNDLKDSKEAKEAKEARHKEAKEARRTASRRRSKKESKPALFREDLEWLQGAKRVPLQDVVSTQPEPEPQAPSVISTASRAAQESARKGQKKRHSSKKEAADFLGLSLCPKEITLQQSKEAQEPKAAVEEAAKPKKAREASSKSRSKHRAAEADEKEPVKSNSRLSREDSGLRTKSPREETKRSSRPEAAPVQAPAPGSVSPAARARSTSLAPSVSEISEISEGGRKVKTSKQAKPALRSSSTAPGKPESRVPQQPMQEIRHSPPPPAPAVQSAPAVQPAEKASPRICARKGSYSLLPDPDKDSPQHTPEPEIVQGQPLILKSGRKGSISLLPDPDSPRSSPDDDESFETSSEEGENESEEERSPEACKFKEGYEPSSGTQTPKTKAVSESSGRESSPCPEMDRVFSLSALDNLLQDPEEKADLRHHLETELADKRPKYQGLHISTPVVVVASEVNPWSKTGGLAMVAGSYGYEFAMRGHRTMVVSPRYGDYKDATYVGYAKVWLDGREHEVRFFHLYQELGEGKGTDYVFVDHESYHRGGLYCDASGKEFPDNLFRYALLTVAAMEAPLVLNLRGSTFGQEVLFVANDWQTGLLPVYHIYKYRRNRTYLNSRCIFVIHNIGYQGKYRLSKFPIDSYLGLPPEAIDLLQGEDLNLGADCMNLMSAAILASDRVLTVSPNYAKEIQSPEGAQGLHEILQEKGRQMRMAGILNGIADEWDPRTDPHIPFNYGLQDFQEGKARNKRELQRSLGLHEDPGAALLGFCGRLCYQKGVHLITQVIPWLLTYEASGVLGRAQVILMGKGDDLYAQQLAQAENNHKGRVCGYVGFDPKIEHRMMAGCDFLLMPSQYEPCGLPQMYAQAYGTVPVVHETGGLKDSVAGLWDEGRDRSTATGFLFSGFDENNLMERLYQALEVYHKKPDLFQQIQNNGLAKNYYWPQAIDEYEKQIDWTLDSCAAAS